MKLTFSQGIISHSTDNGLPSGCPNFWVLQSGNTKIDLHAPLDQPFQLAFAHRDTHYHLTLTNNSDIEAWGYGTSDEYNAPFAIGNGSGDNSDEFYLWVEIDRITGTTSYGYTKWEPTAGSVPPVASNPAARKDDQHWYDTTSKIMKVWNKFSVPVQPYGKWVEKIRVFIGKYNFGTATLVSLADVGSPSPQTLINCGNIKSFRGTHVGLTGMFSAGALVYDSLGNPLIRSDAYNSMVFFTTEDVFISGIPEGSRAHYETFLVDAIGQSPISAYSMVRFSDFNKVVDLEALDQPNSLWGMIEFPVSASGDLVQVVLSGVVRNQNWQWTSIGQQIFVDKDQPGQLAVVEPGPSIVGVTRDYRPLPNQLPVAIAIDYDAVLIRRPELALTTGVINTDHGALNGLSDDDHPQYLNTTRADAAYLRLDATNDPVTGNLRINANVGVNTNPDVNDYTLEVVASGSRAAQFTGDVRVNSQVLAAGGAQDETAPSYAFWDDPNTGLYWVSNDKFGLSAGGTIVIQGATSGIVTFNEAYSFPTADGTNGQALVTNGSGTITFGTPSLALDDLTDVDASSPTTGDLIIYNNVSGNWENGTLELNDLSDVVAPAPGIGDILKFSAGNWVNSGLTLNELTDVSASAPSINEVLKYNGSFWVPAMDSGALSEGGIDISASAPSGSPYTQTIDLDYPLDEGPDGTASAPTYSWGSEPDTGWYHPDIQTVSLSVAGEDSVTVIKRGGSPGPAIGSPDLLAGVGIDLHVVNNGLGDAQIRVENTNAGSNSLLQLITDTGAWEIVHTDTDSELKFSYGGSNQFNITSGGILQVTLAGYETTISDPNDIPNKAYVDNLTLPYDLAYFIAGNPDPNTVVGSFIATRDVTVPYDIPDTASIGNALGHPSAPQVIQIWYNYSLGSPSGTQIGTVTFDTAGNGTVAWTIGSSPAQVTLNAGDLLQLVTPGSVDGNISEISITLVGCAAATRC